VFRGDRPEDQFIAAAAVRRALGRPAGSGRHWSAKAGNVEVFDAKADAYAVLEALGVPTAGLQVVRGGPAWFHPGRSATIQFGPKGVVGAFGEVHPAALEALDVKGPAVAFEILLDMLPPPKAKPTRMKPKLVLSEFQPVSRDFAFVVGRDVAAADILRAAQGADRQLVAGVDVFDVYEGAGIPEDRKSVAVAVTLQPTDKTLTDAEIDAVAGKIVAEVAKKTGAILR
jgi:phenylalanyl-tRNA synthetase beta chain